MLKTHNLIIASIIYFFASSLSANQLKPKSNAETLKQLCGNDALLQDFLNVKKNDIAYACRFLERSGDVRIYPEDGGACIQKYKNTFTEKTELALFHPSSIGALRFEPFGWQPVAEVGKKQYNSIFDRIIGRYRTYAWESEKELYIQSTKDKMASIFRLNKESLTAKLEHFNPRTPDKSSDFTLMMSCIEISHSSPRDDAPAEWRQYQ